MLLYARPVHVREKSNSCSEGDGEVVFIKKRSGKRGKITGLQIFNYLLESSKINFISSAVPVLDVG